MFISVDKVASQVMKNRFVLNPFSFVFLLAGEQSYVVVLETLDTEKPGTFGILLKTNQP